MILAGRVGIVTGAGRGIGRAFALAMARAGASIVVNDAGVAVDGASLADAPADTVVAEIRAGGGQAIADGGSVARWADAHALVTAALDTFGRLDFIVNNAGILRDVIFHKMTESDWDDVIAVHLKGTFNVSRAAADVFRRQEHGAVLNMTSTSGLIGTFGQANYAAAKLGIVGLTRSIALDMRRFNVRANAIAPFAWTRMTETIADAGADSPRVERLQTLRAEQIAPLAVYLVSDAAAVSGQVFAVRGAEIVLFSLPRPVASIHQPGGWTPAAVEERIAELAPSFVPLETTSDVFPGEPKL
jgi:NAD(P)-dependent dehydrogenase (short-subunit alcohol dehydrogenase family)